MMIGFKHKVALAAQFLPRTAIKNWTAKRDLVKLRSNRESAILKATFDKDLIEKSEFE